MVRRCVTSVETDKENGDGKGCGVRNAGRSSQGRGHKSIQRQDVLLLLEQLQDEVRREPGAVRELADVTACKTRMYTAGMVRRRCGAFLLTLLVAAAPMGRFACEVVCAQPPL